MGLLATRAAPAWRHARTARNATPTHRPPLPLSLPPASSPAGQVTTADSEIIMFGGHSQDIEW